jgi:protein-L-isoaspartate(D-aspartate) O-methyltransferase
MPAYQQVRRAMVDGQIRVNDVTEPRLVQAFLDVPREAYVPADRKAVAYLDVDLPVGQGRALMKPMVLARLLNAVGIAPDSMVLDVGAATGYSTAILNRIAGAVVALEEDTTLAAALSANLAANGEGVAEIVTGPLVAGAPRQAPFDAIILAGAVEEVPAALFAQLRDGGQLATVVGYGRAGRATIFRKSGDGISARGVFEAAAPALPGFNKAPAFTF